MTTAATKTIATASRITDRCYSHPLVEPEHRQTRVPRWTTPESCLGTFTDARLITGCLSQTETYTQLMKVIVTSLLAAFAACLVACSPQQAAPSVQTLSPAHSVALTEGRSARLVDGLYDFSISPCQGANTFLLTGRLALTHSRATVSFHTDPSGHGDNGQQWIQAGVYSGAFWNDKVAPCTGMCIGIVTSAEQVNSCGWSLTLHLSRPGQP